MTSEHLIRVDWLLSGPLAKVLFDLSLPMAGGLIALLCLDFIEALFIAQLGSDELTAVSYTTALNSLIAAVAYGFSVAITSILARSIGAKDFLNARNAITDGIVVSTIVASLLAIAGALSAGNFFSYIVVNDQTEVLNLVTSFSQLKYVGMPFFVLAVVISAVLRALGNSQCAARILLIGAAFNLSLDPLLIFGFHFIPDLGMQGAAWASLLSHLAMCIYAFARLRKYEKVFLLSCFDWPHYFLGIQTRLINLGRIVFMSVPVQLMTPISLFILTKVIAVYDEQALIAFGILTRAEPVLLCIPLTLTTSLPVLVGQNWGAGHKDRVASFIRFSFWFATLSQFAIYVAIWFTVEVFSKLLCEDKGIQYWISFAFITVVVSYIGLSLCYISVSVSHAIGKSKLAVEFSCVRFILLQLPLALLGCFLGEGVGFFVGLSLANSLIGVYVFCQLKIINVF